VDNDLLLAPRGATAGWWSSFAVSPLAVALICLGGTIAATWPLTAQFGSALPGNLGDPLLNASILGWNVQWLTGARPGGFWDAPIFHPHPDALAYSEHLLGQTLFVWPIFALTGNAIATYNTAFFASFLTAGIGMYVLLRSLTGRRDVALVFALAFAFSPFRLGGQVARLQMLTTGWLALALWAIHRYDSTKRPRYLSWLAASLLLLILSNMYMIFLAAVPVLLLLTYVIARSRDDRWVVVRGFAATLSLVCVLLLPVIKPYRDLDRQMGLSHADHHVADYSAHVTSYLSAHVSSGWLPWVARENTGDQALYPGMLLLLSVIVAIVAARRRWLGDHAGVVALYSIVAALAMCLSFGPEVRTADGTAIVSSPYEWLRSTVPGLAAVRAPGRYGMVVGLALAVIGALTMAPVFARVGPNARGVLVAAGLALVGFEALPARFEAAPVAPQGRPVDRELYSWLSQQPPSALLELPASPLTMQTESAELLHQFATLQHPHALVNGYSGFNPPLADWIESAESPFIDPRRVADGVALLRSIRVRFVAIHVHDYTSRGVAAGIAQRMRELPDVVAEHRFNDDYVFELRVP
jgi:hypothetical protein